MNAPLRTFTVSTDLKPCECGAFQIGPNWDRVPCGGATTKSTFAPGHDAKLKGFMIRTAVAGQQMRRLNADGTFVERTPLTWASAYGFGHLVRAGIEKAQAKAAPKVPAVLPKVKVVVEEPPAEMPTGSVANILINTPNPADLSREDEATVREALGTFVTDLDEAHSLANLEQAERDGQATDREIVAQLAAEVELPQDDREVFTAKVGRHFYKGLLNLDGEFEYTDRKGNTQGATKFERVTK